MEIYKVGNVSYDNPQKPNNKKRPPIFFSKFNKYFYLSAALAFALCSCSDDDETEGDFTPTVFNVMGKVEKGPMINDLYNTESHKQF